MNFFSVSVFDLGGLTILECSKCFWQMVLLQVMTSPKTWMRLAMAAIVCLNAAQNVGELERSGHKPNEERRENAVTWFILIFFHCSDNCI
jgi:hypothetical protein